MTEGDIWREQIPCLQRGGESHSYHDHADMAQQSTNRQDIWFSWQLFRTPHSFLIESGDRTLRPGLFGAS